MSRIGRKTIEIPKGVSVKITEEALEVQGPKGKTTSPVPFGVVFREEGGTLIVRPVSAATGPIEKKAVDQLDKVQKAAWGMARALAANAVRGVTQGFTRELEIVGVGYKAEVQGRKVVFNLGYSHPIDFPVPEGIDVKIERNRIAVSGIDKQRVGQVAAEIRALRPPDPYKQKGVRRVGELLRKKAGKAAATAAK